MSQWYKSDNSIYHIKTQKTNRSIDIWYHNGLDFSTVTVEDGVVVYRFFIGDNVIITDMDLFIIRNQITKETFYHGHDAVSGKIYNNFLRSH